MRRLAKGSIGQNAKPLPCGGTWGRGHWGITEPGWVRAWAKAFRASVRLFLRLNLLLLLSKRRVSLGSLGKAHPNCRHIDKRSPKLGISGRLSFRHALLCLAAVFIRFHLSIPGR